MLQLRSPYFAVMRILSELLQLHSLLAILFSGGIIVGSVIVVGDKSIHFLSFFDSTTIKSDSRNLL